MSLPPIIQALLKPSVFPELSNTVELRQTHISYLFFTTDFVYKIKKPVDFGFLNFTTLEKRKFYCYQEINLNKRLCPDIYIDVVKVNKKNGQYIFEGEGELVEYAVKMKRLPSYRMMDYMLMNGQLTDNMLADIANVIADFHNKAESNPYITSFGQPSVIKQNTNENFIQSQPFIGKLIVKTQFETIKDYIHSFLNTRHNLFAKRVKEGFIKDCHGDMHLEHICIADKIYIFDCIEFNERFRYSDTVADIAFLSMDLDFYNQHNLSKIFCNAYSQKAEDKDADELLDFYKCYRAYVRGKVEGFKIYQKEVPDRERETAYLKAKRYFYISYIYATGGFRPILILICGLTGTGKSTIANAIAKETYMKVISSDIARKKIADIPIEEHRFEELGKGIYTEEFTEKTYQEIFKQAESYLQKGYSVILDATFQRSKHRKTAIDIAKKYNTDFLVIECVTNDNVVRKRLDNRVKEDRAFSDGRWEIYIKQKEDYETFPSGTWEQDIQHIAIDTSIEQVLIVKECLDKIYQ